MVTQKQRDYKNSYEKENYYKPKIRLPKEKKEVIQNLADELNKSISRVFVEAVERLYGIDLTNTDQDGE